MPKKGQKKKWYWSCSYDQGSGADRECCPVRSKRGFKSKEAAEKAAKKHLNSDECWGRFPIRQWNVRYEWRFHVWSEFLNEVFL